jgi:hypothetical protein
MNGDDSLDAFFDDLRQPATASELAGESKAVDSVVSSLISTKGTSMHILSNSRRLRVASFVAAGIIGFGGVAAAGPAVYDNVIGDDDSEIEETAEKSVVEPSAKQPDPEVETTLPPETTVEETTTTSSSVPDDDQDRASVDAEVDGTTTTVLSVDDPDTAFNEDDCAEGNHGKTVSSVARATPSGPGKGQIVSEAAHSSCGKDDKDADSDSDLDDSDIDDSDSDSDDDDDESDRESRKDKSDKPEKSGGQGNSGRGNSSKDNGGKNRDD